MTIPLRVFALAVFSFGNLWAQADANRAQLVGMVLDPNGAGVPSASIRVRNTATGFGRELQSASDGAYRVVQLDPGTYDIVAKAPGFADTTLSGVTLNVGAAISLDIRLSVQATTVTIEVADTLINTVSATASTVVGSKAIQDLPINGRRFQDFATLTPAVQVDPSRGQLSFAGQRGVNSNIMVDGADYNQPFFGGIRGGERSNFNFTLPQGAVQEFQAVTTGYSAEYGRSTGGILNVITKSGGNGFHGDLFYQNRDRSLSADNPIFRVQPSESLQQFGGSAGGPLIKDKLFLFGAYEQQLAETPAQVYFAQLAGYTPTAGAQEGYDFFKSLEVPFTRNNRAVAGTLRGDYQFAAGHRLTLRYNTSDSLEPNSVTVGGALNPFTNLALSNEGTEGNRTNFGTLQYTHLISPTTVNDVKFSGTYEMRPRSSNSAVPTVVVGSPQIGTFGARNFLPTTQDDTRWQISDGLTAILGPHTVKAGFDVNFLSTAQDFGFNQFGAFNISGSTTTTLLDILGTGGTIANRFDDRSVTYNRQVGNLVADYAEKQLAFYLQDSWRIAPSFTLDFGLRYEAQFNPRVATNNAELINRIQGVRVPNGAVLDVISIKNAVNQFMPRAGFAWSPIGRSSKLVIRGNAGIFYAAAPMIMFSGATNNFRLPAGDVSLSLTPTATQTVYQQLQAAGVDLNNYALGALPVIPVDVVQRASALALGGAARDPFLGAALTFMASDFRNPRSFQTGVGAETQLTSRWVAGAQFNLINTAWLHRNRDYNLPVPVVRDASQRPSYGLRSGTVRPVATQSALTVRESSARALYRGVSVQTTYRGEKFQMGMNYTWSKTMSDDDSERDAGGVNYDDNFNFRPEYNYSNMDATHQGNAYALYRLPWGFEVSGIFRARTGLPFNAITGADTNEDLFNTDRPYSAPGVVFARNAFRNRGVILNNDVRLLKSFQFGENLRLQLSAEIFNVFNADNVVLSGNTGIYGPGISATGETVAQDARFMLLRQANGDYNTQNRQIGNPLQAQFGARFYF